MITLVLAIMSFILVLAKKFKALWFTGLLSLGMTFTMFINFQMWTPNVQFKWECALLIIGPALIIVSAAMESFKEYIT